MVISSVESTEMSEVSPTDPPSSYEDKVVAARRRLLLPVNASEENMEPLSSKEPSAYNERREPVTVVEEDREENLNSSDFLPCRSNNATSKEANEEGQGIEASWIPSMPNMSSWFKALGETENVDNRKDAIDERREQPEGEEEQVEANETKADGTTPPKEKPERQTKPKTRGTGMGDLFTACLGPVPRSSTSASPIDTGEKEDDDSALDTSKLFGDDFESLPSAKGNGESVTSVKTSELKRQRSPDTFPSERGGDLEAIIESKVNEINVPEAMPTTGTGPADSTMEARRQLLIKELKSAISTHGRYDMRVANISAALGDLLNENKEHEHACKLHRDAVAIYSTKLGDDNEITTNAKVRLGQVLEDAGHFEEAINTYYIVMVMRRALKGEKDPTAADALVYMAHALRRKGEYNQAIKELKRSLKIYRESLGDSHEKVSKTVDEIASLYVTIGDFEKSAAILEEVVKLKAATLGLKNKAVAVTLISLATTYECSEEFGKAMKSLKKAYKVYTEVGGYSSEEATSTLNRIAQLYEAQGDNNRASIAYLGVLRGRKINLGEDDLLVGVTYYKLGRCLRETKQYEKALKCMREALPIFVGKGTEMHDVEMIADVMHETALINKDKKHYHEAARVFKQELSVRRKIGQPEYPLIARTLNHLGVAEFEMKNNSRALKYLVQALTIYQKHGEQGIDCAEVLFNTGLVFEAVKNKERAYDAFVEAARIFEERSYVSSHPHLAKADHKIAKLSKDIKPKI